MRRKTISLLLAGVFLGASALASEVVLKKPPESLDNYYPPKSKKWEFLSKMHAMSTYFYGINLNINNEDWKNALRWAKELKKEYVATSKMVPEWKEYFKPKLADELVKAVESKNVDNVLKAAQALGKTCAKCHAEYQLSVKLAYHFPSFESIKLEDPIEFMEMDTGKYMEKMTNSLKALKVYLMQGDKDSAAQVGEEFVERVRALKGMCSKCHTSKLSVEAIMGKEYMSNLDKLGEVLSSGSGDKGKVFGLLQKATSACMKCHNVHLVPAVVQEKFEK